MSVSIRKFSNEQTEIWEDVLQRSVNGTFLHSRRFLSYHGNRFEDFSVVICFKGRPVGFLAAARDPGTAAIVVSHPGITYGGVVHDGTLTGARMIEAVKMLVEHFSQMGFRLLRYKPVPSIYPLSPSQDDIYALSRTNGLRSRCDLSLTIDLSHRLKPSSRRTRSLKKARSTVSIAIGTGNLPAFWQVIEENLARKHGSNPVHSFEEMSMLVERFPNEIALYSAFSREQLIAGVLLFKTTRVWHAQYIGSNEDGYELAALDAVFDELIESAGRCGIRYFDFGTSNENAGLILNEGLFRFKAEFGGTGVAYEQYELGLVGR